MSVLYGLTSHECRRMCIQWYFEPLARKILAESPEVDAVYMGVAQYWNDEANDATHVKVFCSNLPGAKWPNLMNTKNTSDPYATGLCERSMKVLGEKVSESLFSSYFWLDDNGSAIYAFSSYCKEGCTQDDDYEESYLPFAVATRGYAGEVVIDFAGTHLRPNLDDLRSVGYEAPYHHDEETPVPKAFPIRKLTTQELRGVWHELQQLGGGTGWLRHLVHAAEAVREAPALENRWRLSQALDGARTVCDFLGITTDHGGGSSRNEPITGELPMDEPDDHVLRLYGENSADLREMWKDWYFAPLARYIFKNHPSTTNVTAHCARFETETDQDRILFRFTDQRGNDLATVVHKYENLRFREDAAALSSHYTILVAFASHCQEGTYLPYARASRPEKPTNWNPWVGPIEVISKCIRPELEDQWRVGALATARVVEAGVAIPGSVEAAIDKLASPDYWQFLNAFLKCCIDAVNEGSTRTQQELGGYLPSLQNMLEDLGLAAVYKD